MNAPGCRGRRARPRVLLPLHTRREFSHTFSCWYCDLKVTTFNECIFSFGRKYGRCFQFWFSAGVVFSFAMLIGATMILIWESAGALSLYYGSNALRKQSGVLFGLSPSLLRLHIWISDTGYMVFSTLIAVAIHEVGHAFAAASEGIRMEYISIFLAVIFPGALVAFKDELIEFLPHFSALRIYCAGIWHNIALSAACQLALFLLPVMLSPLYIHNESPMVLNLSPSAMLSGYLSYGDLIVSLDGSPIRNSRDWAVKMILLDEETLLESKNLRDFKKWRQFNGRKGYCVPRSLIAESLKIGPVDGYFRCPDELLPFKDALHSNFSVLGDDESYVIQNETDSAKCLPPTTIVNLKKCGDGWKINGAKGNHCQCLQDEDCLAPVQMPGFSWVEIAYLRPYSLECMHRLENSSLESKAYESRSSSCGGTFVFVGDAAVEAHSIQLTSYHPRWAFSLGLHLPNILENILTYIFYVSASLALLNSLPIYFLDGESILEACLRYMTWLGPGRQQLVLKTSLFCGSLLSLMALTWIFIFIAT